MLQIGSLVDGKYKILSQIGKGGMSVVYMAINEKANKTWAVKEVRKDGILDYEAVKQGLIAETDMLKKLNHPHLPSIIDVIEDEDSFLIVMDYIEGISLKKQLEEYGAQPQQDVIKWAKQLCEVFAYLHSRTPPIIYRDMKPGNIMLKPNGDVVLIDFGTAREFKASSVDDTKCLGTIGYAAPEQFGGMGQTDGRTDIYCLGTTMYHLVTGHNPSAPPYEILPIRQINEALSGGLEQIILKCTQQNPDNRYQSAAELMYALENFQTFDGEEKRKQKRRLGTFLACAGMSLVCLGAAIGFGSQATGKATDRYENVLFEAESAIEDSRRIEKYLECIDIPQMAGRKEAYIGLFETYKRDMVFTREELETAVNVVSDSEHSQALLADPETYGEICFELGKLYWYYYDDADQTNRAKSAVPWFEKAIKNSSEQASFIGTARAYASIGHFYTSIASSINEASDQGMYKELFHSISQIVDSIANDVAEPDIVRLEIFEMSRNMLEQYATRLKRDGISSAEAMGLFEKIRDRLPSVPAETDKCRVLKDATLSRLEKTKETVSLAYGT